MALAGGSAPGAPCAKRIDESSDGLESWKPRYSCRRRI